MELEVTWARATRIWWAVLWRNLVGAIVMALIGGLIGGLLGYIMGSFGAKTATIQMVAIPIGVILGIGISILAVKLVIGKDFGDYRLLLVAKERRG